MIKIKLPGTKNIFIINDLSISKSVENEIFNTFYPYAIELTKLSYDIRWDIWIERNDKNIRVKSRKNEWKILTTGEMSPFDYYKRIYSIIRENLQLEDEYCFLHGSAVLIDGCTCLFLAETGMGKSTLSVYFDMYGHRCLTDDLIILNKKSHVIYPISRYAHIRKQGLFLFQNNTDSLIHNGLIDRYEYLLSEERFQYEHKVQYVFMLHRGFPITDVRVCDSAFEWVLENMFLPYQIKNNINSAITISNDIPVFDMYYNNLEQAKILMLSLIKKAETIFEC